MTAKRKRSEDVSPLSLSSFGGLSTPDTEPPSCFSRHRGAMEMDTDTASRSNPWNFANASRVKSSDWGHRTRKRFRDNRPDEQAIHESTLNKLFAAQQPTPLAPALATTHLSRPVLLQQKSTLHSFWKQLPAPPVRPLIFPIQPRQLQSPAQPPQCDDCDAPLVSDSDDMDVDMNVDIGGAMESRPFACCDCGKRVCGMCAVAGARRVCLECATTSGAQGNRWW